MKHEKHITQILFQVIRSKKERINSQLDLVLKALKYQPAGRLSKWTDILKIMSVGHMFSLP
jgi:hypothetical protein